MLYLINKIKRYLYYNFLIFYTKYMISLLYKLAKSYSIAFVCFLFFTNFKLFAFDEISNDKLYDIDFERQSIIAVGIAGQPWEEENYVSSEKEKIRAHYDALHHAYEAILNIPIMEGKYGKHILFQTPVLKEKIKNLLFSLQPTFIGNKNKLIKCKLEIPFYGINSLFAAFYLASLYPTSKFQSNQNIPSSKIWPLVLSPTNSLKVNAELEQKQQSNKIKTKNAVVNNKIHDIKRIIIDLRNTPFQPSLFPCFYTEKGQLIFQESLLYNKSSRAKFSRPIIKFYKSILKATENYKENELEFINAKTTDMSTMNITILSSSEVFFVDYVSYIMHKPESDKDIAIVYGNEYFKFSPGLLAKPFTTSHGIKSDKITDESIKEKAKSKISKHKRIIPHSNQSQPH